MSKPEKLLIAFLIKILKSLFSSCFILERLKCSMAIMNHLAVIGQNADYNLDKSSVHHKTNLNRVFIKVREKKVWTE